MINETALRIGEKLLQNRSVSRFQLRQALALQHDTSERLGPLLTRLGYLPESRLEQIAQVVPQAPTCLRLGELLLRKAWITATQLDDALTEQRHSEEDLGALLIRKGWLSPDRLEQALTEQLLVRAPTHRRRLGHILIQTRQLSQWQLNLALRLKQALPAADEPLGELLVRLEWLQPQQLGQALRLQKRLLRSMAGVFLGTSLMVGCKAPTVPLQMPYAGNMQIAAAQPQARAQGVLGGAFKTLAVEDSDEHQIKIRVYQNGSRVLENVPYSNQGNDNTCGQAVSTMVANFWDKPTDYQSLVNRNNRLNLATTAGMIVNTLREKGLEAQDFRDASLENLIAETNKGRPSIVLLDFGSIQTAHYVVVIGYNPKRGTIIMHDSLEAAYVEMPQQTFLNMWDNKSVRSVLPVGGTNYRRLMIKVSHPKS